MAVGIFHDCAKPWFSFLSTVGLNAVISVTFSGEKRAENDSFVSPSAGVATETAILVNMPRRYGLTGASRIITVPDIELKIFEPSQPRR